MGIVNFFQLKNNLLIDTHRYLQQNVTKLNILHKIFASIFWAKIQYIPIIYCNIIKLQIKDMNIERSLGRTVNKFL